MINSFFHGRPPLHHYCQNNPLIYVDPSGHDDIRYDEEGYILLEDEHVREFLGGTSSGLGGGRGRGDWGDAYAQNEYFQSLDPKIVGLITGTSDPADYLLDYNVEFQWAREGQREIVKEGLAALIEAIINSPEIQAYFKALGIDDIAKALAQGDGPTIIINTYDTKKGKYGEYDPKSNTIYIYFAGCESIEAFTHTLIHELGHWAYREGGWNPDGPSPPYKIPTFCNPNPRDGRYGYAAELILFGYIYPYDPYAECK